MAALLAAAAHLHSPGKGANKPRRIKPLGLLLARRRAAGSLAAARRHVRVGSRTNFGASHAEILAVAANWAAGRLRNGRTYL
jgi:hypothetical protein